MRDIKFRGISTKSGHFVYGYYYWYADFEYIKEVFDVPPTWDEPGGDIKMYDTKVKSGTVGQYTGLKDKNGVEIYEGDIVKTGLFINPAFVSYEGGYPGVTYNGRYRDMIYGDFCECEVIGNIHEHPNLLK